jgi:hypothetical protein
MSLKPIFSLLAAASVIVVGSPILAQAQSVPGADPSIPGAPGLPGVPGVPGADPAAPPVDSGAPAAPTGPETAPPESEPITPEPDPAAAPEPPVAPTPIGGGTAPTSTGTYTLVQCGPNGTASLVEDVPVGCHILGVNSPPGQAANALSPESDI